MIRSVIWTSLPNWAFVNSLQAVGTFGEWSNPPPFGPVHVHPPSETRGPRDFRGSIAGERIVFAAEPVLNLRFAGREVWNQDLGLDGIFELGSIEDRESRIEQGLQAEVLAGFFVRPSLVAGIVGIFPATV